MPLMVSFCAGLRPIVTVFELTETDAPEPSVRVGESSRSCIVIFESASAALVRACTSSVKYSSSLPALRSVALLVSAKLFRSTAADLNATLDTTAVDDVVASSALFDRSFIAPAPKYR